MAHAMTEERPRSPLLEQGFVSSPGLARAIIDSSDDAIISTDLDGTIISWNRAAETMYGYPAADVIGKTIAVIISPTKLDEMDAILTSIRAGERIKHFETERLRNDATAVPVSVSISPVIDGKGAVIGAASISRDITERQRSEERLREASRYARSLLEASLDPLVTINPEGTVTDVNDAVVKVTGVARAKLIGTDFSSYFTDPENAKVAYERVLSEGTVTDYPLTIRHRDGRLTSTLNNAAVYRDARGNVLGVFAAARDITAQQQAQEEIRTLNRNLEQRVRDRTAELEASTGELEAFTYSVSHDLRAPLRAVAGFAGLLRKNEGDRLGPIGLQYLGRIDANAARMGRLIDELLRFTRIGRAPLRLAEVDPSELARASLEQLRPRTGNGEDEVEVVIVQTPRCRADANLLRQLYFNLLDNAIKFSAGRPGARVEVGCHLVGSEPVYDVRDNGVGFDMRYADKLFGVFQRLHSEIQFEGSGMGLAMAQRIVHRHGGRIWAEGEPDKGAAVHFTLTADES